MDTYIATKTWEDDGLISHKSTEVYEVKEDYNQLTQNYNLSLNYDKTLLFLLLFCYSTTTRKQLTSQYLQLSCKMITQ